MPIVGVGVPVAVAILLLRHRAARLAERSPQQRCNKCGTVIAA